MNVVNLVCISTCVDTVYILSNNNFAAVLQANVNVSHINVSNVNEPRPHNVSQVSHANSLGNIQSMKKK